MLASSLRDAVGRASSDEGPDATTSPFVSVLIVSYRSAGDLEPCLAALAASTHADFEVVVCENGGEAAHAELLRRLPATLAGGQPVRMLLAPGNLGYAGGVNFCIANAPPSDAYWVLNPDTVPEPDALEQMLDRLQSGGCTAVGHDLMLPEGVLASRGGGRWPKSTARAISIDHGRPREPVTPAAEVERSMDYIVGASMLLSAGWVERIGPMREDYFLYCEEIEWCLRATASGERIGYAPDAVVLHRHGTSTGGGGAMNQRSRLSVYLVERNRLLLTRDLFPAALATAIPFALVHLLLRYAKARAWAQVGYAFSGWLAGCRDERGPPPFLT
jgi:GT2 family glycosyltransferase